MYILSDKLLTEKGELIKEPELLKQAIILMKNFDKLNRRKKISPRYEAAARNRRDIHKNEKIETIIQNLRNLEEDLIAKRNPLSMENVRANMRHVLDGQMGYFTGKLKIGIENNSIVEVELVPLETEEDLSEVTIPKERFNEMLDALQNPKNANPESKKLAEGIPIEKLERAIELKAEKIIKTPFLKLDGSVEYKITASLEY